MKNEVMYIESISVEFNGFKALNKVNMFVNNGELRFLIGPNGAGKTTLLDVICGKVKPSSGRVYFKDNIDVLAMTPNKICKAGISRKFQAPSIFGNLTVYENMELALAKSREVFTSLFHKLTREDNDKIDETLKSVNLVEKKKDFAGSLAHGEKQWLEIAMTIIQDPLLLLVDEPVAGMTGKEREYTGVILQEISKKRSVIVVEHDMNFVEMFSNAVTVLHEGRILCEGTFDEIKNDPYVIEVYLGRDGGKVNVKNK
jgi:urea transport system ATP-binding protein